MKSYKVTIKANPIFPYMMQHRMDDTKLEEWEKNRKQIIERAELNDEDSKRAAFHSYLNKDGKAFIPTVQIKGALINSGKSIKAKVGNANKNMSNIVAGQFYIRSENENAPEEIELKSESYEIDKRSAVNRNIKARIISIRPKWKNWSATFKIIVDNDTITDSTIETLIKDAGNNIGIGSYRPQNKGEFGRFIIDKFEKI